MRRKKKDKEREGEINGEGRDRETGMLKKWRLRDGGIKKDIVRQQLRVEENRGIEDGGVGQEWWRWWWLGGGSQRQ